MIVRLSGVVLVALFLFASASAPCGAAPARKKGRGAPARLIGVWVAAKGEGLPRGSTLQFRRKGKLTITVQPPGGKAVPIQGTYKVAGKKIDLVTFDANGEPSKGSAKIKVLTAKRLVLVDEKGQQNEFVKK
jgi:uncharacterized protein (TIGR03066 family)